MTQLNELERAVLGAVEREHGVLLAEEVREVARDPDSPLHRHFEWDDAVASEAYRLEQARHLIRSYKVEIRIERVEYSVPRYVRDTTLPAKQPGYVNTSHLRKDKDKAHEILVAEFRRAAEAIRRAKALAAYLGMSDEIDDLLLRIGSLQQRAAPDQPGAH